MTSETNSTVPNLPELGKWQTSCGPGENQSTFSKVLEIGSLVLGVGSFLVPVFQPPKPQDAGAIWALFGMLGGFLILVGIVMLLLHYVFYDKTVVHLYDRGVAIRPGASKPFVSIPWQAITKLSLHTVHEDRFSSHMLAIIEWTGPKVQFSSKLKGDPASIMDELASNVRNVEEKEYSLG